MSSPHSKKPRKKQKTHLQPCWALYGWLLATTTTTAAAYKLQRYYCLAGIALPFLLLL
ncbi:hypothetical protein P175DRAFT_0151087 [Aspergillus ochraceoroseus IBT 24754]|uniref:Uncharacterized protein n=1 Tax=Aspergillus ochraceoroseus IBT 24754 TaxID=1392256 RepID=A0A2T5M331_9EURO|nr:uncharacterized protein P175DRAFT_0151087 [Aspergillus ochraceoroseus IBT 24754]PTU22938.1 hypothetical protein P175DRAFT_0151087 [Aspergillus ochraceoroseus IBT 24754]